MSNPVEEIVSEFTLENEQKASNHNDDDSGRRAQNNKKIHLFNRHNTIHSALGGGKLADILLWRNKKISGGLLAGATAIWFLFECTGYHLLALICHSLIASLAILFFWSNLSLFVNKKPQDVAFPLICIHALALAFLHKYYIDHLVFSGRRFIELPKIELPEELWMQSVLLLSNQCICAFGIFREVASGNDLTKFLYAIFSLWIVSIIGRWFRLLTLVYLIFAVLLTVPFLYEKYEDQVDGYGKRAIKELRKQYSQVDEKVLQKLPIPFTKASKQD